MFTLIAERSTSGHTMLIFKHIAPVLILMGCLAQVAAAATPKAYLLCAITNVCECEVLKGCTNHYL